MSTSPNPQGGTPDALAAALVRVETRLERIEADLTALVRQAAVKEHYDVDEAAAILHRAAFTVREWCRLGRIRAEKKGSGRGKHQGWTVSHAELLRVQREGLLPLKG